MNNLAVVCLVGLGEGRNYVRCLVIVVISVRLGGARGCGGGFKVIILIGVARGRGQDQFSWGVLTPLHTMNEVSLYNAAIWKHYCKSCQVL